MNEVPCQGILVEVRRLRRDLQFAAIVGGTALLVVLAFCVWFSRPHAGMHNNLWGAVREAMDHMEYERAAAYAQQIVAKYPGDYNGYAYLGNIALITGQVRKAEAFYAQADKLFPSEQNERMLATVRTRLHKESAEHATAQ